ncbi:iron-containing alcohol dehydrogenase [Saccharopolyspora sp. TS4A08]|uniref:Iron-containing alcohol dehydrogenase n=1 Tax=Saccharopolyspora ipomoeae TaxID=3042027 RepID=A0ABT6PQB5_9PSEU|nr:iron-containing alcohol dehydrogenase [Saccharopolyspora sp. TS4A08]MDI2030192.1 iron-containing alcohol dehydrogenase [Saccharopolyspora sp. TS4A08]
MRPPAEVLFGNGSRAALPRVLADRGTRVFVCSDPVIAETDHFARFLDAARERGLHVTAYSDVQPELPLAGVARATDAARRCEPDVVVGYGGGSTVDLAKLLAITLVTDDPLSSFYGENLVPAGVLPVVAVPTTAGTGSEATPVAVVSDPSRALKVGISSPRLVPVAAVVDPELTHTCPATVTAFSGIDALTHAIESASARRQDVDLTGELPVFVGANALSSVLARQAAAAIAPNLAVAVREPSNGAARANLAYGSLLAGMAFGSGGTHLSHALQYPIGDVTRTPHGLGVGLLLPYVMESCLPSSTPVLADLAKVMGACDAGADDDVAAVSGIRAVVELRAAIGVPHTLADIGVARSDLGRIGELAAGVGRLLNNAPAADPRALIEPVPSCAWSGRSDTFAHART